MDEKQAREILMDEVEANNELYSLGRYISWGATDRRASLDGNFTADELEAIAWWMKNKAAANIYIKPKGRNEDG